MPYAKSDPRASSAAPLVIEHAVTADDPIDGNPVLPGYCDDELFWAVVAPLPGGRDRWRRLYLKQIANPLDAGRRAAT
jgi:hypothetical protein